MSRTASKSTIASCIACFFDKTRRSSLSSLAVAINLLIVVCAGTLGQVHAWTISNVGLAVSYFLAESASFLVVWSVLSVRKARREAAEDFESGTVGQ